MAMTIPAHAKMPLTVPPSMKCLRILCFGDSLTEGYSQYGSLFTPYSDSMFALLEEKFRKGKEKEGEMVRAEVDTQGVSGESVLDMRARMEVICKIPHSISISISISMPVEFALLYFTYEP